jgi:tetratricopeptide (TPR) repeat protein
MKNKKAMAETEVVMIFIAVAIIAIIIIAIFPKIKDLPRKGLEALGLKDDKCEYSGLTADDYSEKISRSMYNGKTNIAISYFHEFREKCDFEMTELTIFGGQGREKSIELAEEFCTRGDFVYAKEIYTQLDKIDEELSKGELHDKCMKFAELSIAINLDKFDEAQSIADSMTILEDDPASWNILLGDSYFEIGEYQTAYNVYIREYEETINPFIIISQSRLLVKLKNLYISVLAERFISSDTSFCFKVPEEYSSGINSASVNDRIKQMTEQDLEVTGLQDVEKGDSFGCQKSGNQWACQSRTSCSTDIMGLIS